jgi:putative intracellular protease/amidase
MKWTLINSPATCDLICTVEAGSTVPITRICTGTASLAATATLTGTGGIPPTACACCLPQPDSASANAKNVAQ